MRIAQILRKGGVPTNTGGKVQLSAEDASTLMGIASAIQSGSAPPGGDLLEIDNVTAEEGSFQPNASIGDGKTDDPYAVYNYKVVRVRNAVAKPYSTQINHPIAISTHERANAHQLALAQARSGHRP